jgi:hydroxyacylglutathione hydrolase
MKIFQLEVGMIGTNCYIAVNEKTKHGVVIDPGDEGERIVSAIQREGLTIDAIFITHGHSDHIMGLNEVRAYTKAKVYISQADANCLGAAKANLSIYMMGKTAEFAPADVIYKDGDEIEAAGMKFQVLATPGHTKGGVCLKCGNVVFCGDTIFAESVGRTDLPGGDYDEIIKSIKDKILPLPDGVQLLPGHGPATSVGWERRRNPFLQ